MRGRLQRAVLYGGGFLGPFGGSVVASVLPEIGDDLGVSPSAAASSLTAYLLPFAALMLFSGTLGARWGRVRTVRIAYGVYFAASAACVLAPTFAVFMVARVVQGSANSFTTPLLMASLAAVTPRARLGRALGVFGAFQAAGQACAPLVGGLAAEIDWRLAFAVIAVVAAVMGAIGLPTPREPGAASTPRLRDALTLPVLRTGVVALLGWGALGGLNFLVAFRAEDVFGLSPTTRGLVLTGFGIAGIVTARAVGGAIDRVGSYRAIVIGALSGAALVTVVGTVPSVAALAAGWFLAGMSAQFVLVAVNAAVLGSGARNSSGAVSVVQAFRFSGNALAPLALTPVYGWSPAASFVLPAVLLAVAAPMAMPRTRGRSGGRR
ncbi:MFS transporter [Rhodococcus sp. HNM0569]|uniref:MFS transporter n=1 Tax=Rhodococcus sp. HNM0569 TaxID=2716340 RepID=UPI00146B8F76|nr:MFS transporter [Rhodococcus sp. HNM0569]NLU84916.1 MFS transporter [Rhodococcus sp. HNM0569]